MIPWVQGCRRVALGLLLVAPLGVLAGCTPPTMVLGTAFDTIKSRADAYAQAPEAVAWRKPVPEVADAARAALNKLGFLVRIDGARADSVWVEASDQQDRRVMVRIGRVTSEITQVRVRVGLYGDGPVTKLFFDAMSDELLVSPASQ